MDTFSKHFTHSLSFNKCAVASVKVVSARKETRSAHVAISKMDVQNEGGQERKAPKQWKHPQSRHEVNLCPCLFLQTCMHVPGLSRLSRLCSSSAFSLPGGVPSLVSGLDFLASVLVLYGTYRAHGERMESIVSPERAYRTDT